MHIFKLSNQHINIFVHSLIISLAHYQILIFLINFDYQQFENMIELFNYLIDFVLNMDKHLIDVVNNYHTWTYLLLFIILFAETGLVITPFLPGDSLLFAVGAVAAMNNTLNIYILVPLLLLAVFLGDNSNYFIGRYIGEKVYEKNYRLIKKKYLLKTRDFYAAHGGATLILARFMPVIRTFAPFVAGVSMLRYSRYVKFCIIGSMIWVNLACWSGYMFGNIPFVKNNFSIFIVLIIFVTFLPPLAGYARTRYKTTKQAQNNTQNSE